MRARGERVVFRALWLVWVLVFSIGATPTRALKISIDELIKLTLERSESIELGRLEVERSENLRRQALGLIAPDISAHGAYTYIGKRPERESFGSTSETGRAYQASLRLEQWLYSGSVGAAARGSKHLLAASRADLQRRRSESVAATRIGAYDLILARERIAALTESLDRLRSILTDTRKRQAVGLSSSYEFSSVSARIAAARADLARARSRRSLAELNLILIAGLDPDRVESIEITDRLSSLPEPIDSEGLIERAQESRPDIVAARERAATAREEWKKERGARLPTLKFFGSYNFFKEGDDRPFLEEWEEDWNVGVALEAPLFDGRERVSAARAQGARMEMSFVEYAHARRRVAIEIRGALAELESARADLKARDAQRKHARETYRIARARHKVDLISQLELLDSQLELTLSDIEYHSAARDYMSAREKFKLAVGEI